MSFVWHSSFEFGKINFDLADYVRTVPTSSGHFAHGFCVAVPPTCQVCSTNLITAGGALVFFVSPYAPITVIARSDCDVAISLTSIFEGGGPRQWWKEFINKSQ